MLSRQQLFKFQTSIATNLMAKVMAAININAILGPWLLAASQTSYTSSAKKIAIADANILGNNHFKSVSTNPFIKMTLEC